MTIYQLPPRSLPYTITVDEEPLNEWLGGWAANCVIVDNHANQHVLLPDVGLYCPPFTVGKVVPVPALHRVRALFATPPGLPVPPTIAGQIATLTFYAEGLSPHPGVADGQIATAQPQRLIAEIITAGTGLAQSETVALPAGTQAVGYVVSFGAFHNPNTVSITGIQSGRTWLINNSISGAPLDFQVAPVVAGLDTEVRCTVMDAGLPCKVDFVAWLANPTSFLLPSYDQGAIAIPVTFSPSGGPAANPAPWQAARSIVDFAIDLSVAGLHNVLAAIPGQTIWLFDIDGDVTVAGGFAGNWQDTAGVLVSRLGFQNNSPRSKHFSGAPLQTGRGLDFNVFAAGVSFYVGHVAHTLA
jgi:hypothetical protein